MLLISLSPSFLQVEHLQTSVTEEYARYLNEHGARKLLLAKLNDMHNERLEMTQRQAQGRERGVSVRTCPAQTPKCMHLGAALQEKIQSISEIPS